MTNTINNVPRELLERILFLLDTYVTQINPEEDELRALLSAPSPAGVDGLEVVTVRVCGYAPGLGQVTVQLPDGEYRNWSRRLELGEHVQVSVNPPDAQAIIDGLRGEVAEERAKVAQLEEGIPRIMEASYQFRQQRDQHAGLLREVHDTYRAAIHWEDLRSTMKRIDTALAELPQ